MSLQALLKHGFSFGLPQTADADSPNGIAQNIQGEALTILKTLAQAVELAKQNPDLTFEGKGKAKRKAGEAALKALNELRGSAANAKLAKLLQLAEEALDRSLPGDPDSAAQAIREAEVRQRLDSMDKSERLSAIRQASADGDMLVINAIRNAPAFLQYLPADMLETAISDYINKRSPDQALKLRTTREASEVVGMSIADVTSAVHEAADLAPDPAARIRDTAPDNAGGAAA